MFLLLEHLTFEAGCCRSVCKLIRSRWVVFTQFLFQSFQENNLLPSVLWSERCRLGPSCNCKTELTQWLHIFFVKSVPTVWHKNIILVQFDDEPQGSPSGRGDRLCVSRGLLTTWGCAAGSGDKQAVSPRKGGATDLKMLLLDLKNSRELEMS